GTPRWLPWSSWRERRRRRGGRFRSWVHLNEDEGPPPMGADPRAVRTAVVPDLCLEGGLVQLHQVQLDALGDLAGQGHAGQDVGREELRRGDLAGVERLVLGARRRELLGGDGRALEQQVA